MIIDHVTPIHVMLLDSAMQLYAPIDFFDTCIQVELNSINHWTNNFKVFSYGN